MTVIGCISPACQSTVGPAVQVRVLATQKAIPGKPNSTHTSVQDLRCKTKVHTLTIPVAAVCVVFARIVWFTHLGENTSTNTKSTKSTNVFYDCRSK